LPQNETPGEWRNILKREPRCVEWNENEIRALVSEDKFPKTLETVRKISRAELLRFKIGLDGLPRRVLKKGDCAVAVLSAAENDSLISADGFHRAQLEAAQKCGAKTGTIYFGREGTQRTREEISVFIPVPQTGFLLDGVTRVAVKLVMNALSTCTMVRLGRVMGNYMVWVVPSNLKLIDRATRYITKLTDLNYEPANALLFDIIEYVEPRMKSDQAYPPVVGMAVLRAKFNLTNEAAEKHLLAG
jgi:N-acetylmuramic acid 6-phosphate etherase